MYLVHTYLSVFAKLLAYSVLTGKVTDNDVTLKAVLKGEEFHKLNVHRFVEDDFFHWVVAPVHFKILKPMFRELNLRISDYDFATVEEDILKGVYQELIDLETRHALGEYYTPDWLCERIVSDLHPQIDSHVLDPACGSGSFLRATVAYFQREYPHITADRIATQVCGIDIHPLSVQIAKTTLLLSLGKSVASARQPVTLRIYLANSLMVPKATADLLKSTFKVIVDNSAYTLDVSGLADGQEFDAMIEFCGDLLERYKNKIGLEEFRKLAFSLRLNDARHVVEDLHSIYLGMKKALDSGRDTIWKFILLNSYKPIFMRGSFDFVVGNPPWLTYSNVANSDYQAALKEMATEYDVVPALKNMPHLEIAAIFLAHSINYFLKPAGHLAFVLPRSFMTADQHENTRAGTVKGLKLVAAWDLENVTPLFRVPCCVFFAVHGREKEAGNKISSAGVVGITFSGKLRPTQRHWKAASKSLVETKVQWYLSFLRKSATTTRTALTRNQFNAQAGANHYSSQFKQGATIVPRSFYFVDFESTIPGGEHRERVCVAKTSISILRDAKAPWKNLTLNGRIDGRNLFRTAISKNILPFALVNPPWVVLPVDIESQAGVPRFTLLDDKSLLEIGAKHTSQWMYRCQELWNTNRTQKSAF